MSCRRVVLGLVLWMAHLVWDRGLHSGRNAAKLVDGMCLPPLSFLSPKRFEVLAYDMDEPLSTKVFPSSDEISSLPIYPAEVRHMSNESLNIQFSLHPNSDSKSKGSILLSADSHGHLLVGDLQSQLPKCIISSIFKPNATLSSVLSCAPSLVSNQQCGRNAAKLIDGMCLPPLSFLSSKRFEILASDIDEPLSTKVFPRSDEISSLPIYPAEVRPMSNQSRKIQFSLHPNLDSKSKGIILLSADSHGHLLVGDLQFQLPKCIVSSIFKPNATLSSVLSCAPSLVSSQQCGTLVVIGGTFDIAQYHIPRENNPDGTCEGLYEGEDL
ncbi:unnamed protein product [Darwinula stevensoni]|uniref:Uncharacterized protein n=1 Tax=Darwinula stevensoni TaxID=69355 RepID=A0A7R9AF80_9CRUS|nr:unnamed protein product [Darwinula stevensoni]CAG0902137.1 unnamed protein product [Darwinula stevensoni]